MKLQQLLSYVRRACQDYDMIQDGDRIAVGISGGKDSLSLLVALKELQRFYPKKYELEAITVSLGLPNADYTPVAELCQRIGVNYTIIDTRIGKIVFEERKEKNPCSLCAKMRKGAFNTRAKEMGCNKVAYGHNKDDVIHTLFLAMFYEGRIHTFRPVTYLSEKDLHTIRPLIYAPEKEIISFIKKQGIKVVKSPCFVDGKTVRQEIREFVKDCGRTYEGFDTKVFGAIQRSNIEGWGNR